MIKSLLIAPLQGPWRAGLQKLAAAALLALIVMAGAPDLSLAQTAAPAAKPKAQAAPASESGLKARVDSLEEQLVDMQVLVGTLESLARQGGAGAPAARAWRRRRGLGACRGARIPGAVSDAASAGFVGSGAQHGRHAAPLGCRASPAA